MSNSKHIYFDYNATTPCDPEVLQQMLPYFSEKFGNNNSLHCFGRESQKAVDKARDSVAKILNCKSNEIYFTSGGTESDNFAIRGVAYANRAEKNHIITSKIEHHAVLNTVAQLEKEGFLVTYLDVDSLGRISLTELENAITDKTCLVSIMYANNEVGTIQPIEKIGEICREKGVFFHTDAVQAFGSQEIDVKRQNIDLLSMSAHKFYGPKGIGVLYIRNGIRVKRLIFGGVQERNMRAGTTNTPHIIGLSEALSRAISQQVARNAHNLTLKLHLYKRLINEFEHIKINGDLQDSLPNTLNVSFRYIEGESLLLSLDLEGIAVSSGSACTSGSLKSSHVLIAMGLEEGLAHGSLRFSFGKQNTLDEVDYAVDKLKIIVNKLRAMSPLF